MHLLEEITVIATVSVIVTLLLGKIFVDVSSNVCHNTGLQHVQPVQKITSEL